MCGHDSYQCGSVQSVFQPSAPQINFRLQGWAGGLKERIHKVVLSIPHISHLLRSPLRNICSVGLNINKTRQDCSTFCCQFQVRGNNEPVNLWRWKCWNKNPFSCRLNWTGTVCSLYKEDTAETSEKRGEWNVWWIQKVLN